MAPLTHALALLVTATGLQTQDNLWNRAVVLRPDTTVVEVRQGIEYKQTMAGPLRMDIYRPRKHPAPLPAVVFVHGGPVPAGLPRDVRLAGIFTSYGRLVASHGLVAVTFTHRLAAALEVDSAAVDVRDAVRYLVTHADDFGLDPNRLCIWGISRGGLVLSLSVRSLGTRLRCLVLYYAIVESPTPTGGTPTPMTPSLVAFIGAGAVLPPTLIARAGRDEPQTNTGLDRLTFTAMRHSTNVDLLAYAEGRHAFDVLDDTPRTRDIISRTLAFIRSCSTAP